MAMPWTWDEIRNELSEGDQTLDPQDAPVEVFDFVEQYLGHDWVKQQHESGTLYGMVGGQRHAVGRSIWCGRIWADRVEAMARQLRALRESRGFGALLERIKSDDRSALSELFSAYLCIPVDRSAKVEFSVDVEVDGRPKNIDFRISRGDDPWTNVEVTAPEAAQSQGQATSLLGQLKTVVEAVVPANASVEVMLRREPQDRSELKEVVEAVRNELAMGHDSSKDIPGLCLLIVRRSASNLFVVGDNGEANASRIGMFGFGPSGSGYGNVTIRLEYSDERAEKILHQEAKQLPGGTPSIVFVDGTRGSVSFSDWQRKLLGRFQRGVQTHVSAVVMYLYPVIGGLLLWVLENPRATHKAPRWLMERIRSWTVQGQVT